MKYVLESRVLVIENGDQDPEVLHVEDHGEFPSPEAAEAAIDRTRRCIDPEHRVMPDDPEQSLKTGAWVQAWVYVLFPDLHEPNFTTDLYTDDMCRSMAVEQWVLRGELEVVEDAFVKRTVVVNCRRLDQ